MFISYSWQSPGKKECVFEEFTIQTFHTPSSSSQKVPVKSVPRSTLWALHSFVHSQVLSPRQEELLEAALAVFWPTHEGLLSQENQSTLLRHRNGTPQGFVLRCCNNMPKKHIYFPQYIQSQLSSAQKRINNFSPEFHGNLTIHRNLPG